MIAPPVVLAYGIGVDSTALLIEKVARGEPPDLVLSADTGVEKPETYAYLDIIRPWMDAHGIQHELVSYQPKRFKHWPPYYGLLEMCLTNATLPSKSLGGSSCSLKYKKAPQDAFLSTWQPAVDAWQRGQRVIRLIGYDAGPRDTKRANHALSIDDPLYDCQYPLREWRWDRDACIERIQAAGLPVPPKSACWLCVANKPDEICSLPAWCLRLIVLVEARAAPRLHTVKGLWRSRRMTDFIRAEGLLSGREIDRIWRDAPLDLIRFQEVAALVPVTERPTMQAGSIASTPGCSLPEAANRWPPDPTSVEAAAGWLYGLDRAFTRAERGALLVEVQNRRLLMALGRNAPKAKGPRLDPSCLPDDALERLIQSHADVVLVDRLRSERERRAIERGGANPYYTRRRLTMAQTATSGEVSKAFGRFSPRALVEPLTITNCGDEALVLMSMQEYTRLKSRDRVAMSIDEVTREMRDAVAASTAPDASKAFNHEMD